MPFLNRCFTFFLVALFLGFGLSVSNGVQIQFDYSYDTSGFFGAGTDARGTLEAVGNFYGTNFDDYFTAIDSNQSNQFDIKFWAPNSGDLVTHESVDIPEDTLVVYVGGRDLEGSTLGQAGPGGWSVTKCNSQSWLDNARTRGQGAVADVEGATATDFSLWGGSITIDNVYSWNSDYQTTPSYGENDLYSVLLHEMAHVLGFGIADSWGNLVDSSGNFVGSTAVSVYGGTVPTDSYAAHWNSATNSSVVFGGTGSQEAVMEPSLTTGTRRLVTDLDMAGLDDIGWQVLWPEVPTDPSWINASGGAFSVAANWSTGTVPAASETALFDISGAYTVTFPAGGTTVNEVGLTEGTVTWDLGDSTLNLNRLEMEGASSGLILENGTMSVSDEMVLAAETSLAVGAGGLFAVEESASLTGSLEVLANGMLQGAGTLEGNLSNSGTVCPGDDTGTLFLNGNYTQGSGGQLSIDISGSPTEGNHDRLLVNGTADLDGTLVVDWMGGTLPEWKEQYLVFSAGSVTGDFSEIESSAMLSNGMVLSPAWMGTGLVLNAYLAGDANLDGVVNAPDFAILMSNWYQSVDGWGEADFNGDGFVDASDFAYLSSNWQRSVEGIVSVPEPGLMVTLLALFGFLGMARVVRRSK